MLLTWMWLPVLGLLAGQGEAQSCRPDLIGVAINVARGRPAFQSSTFPSQFNSVASKAVDGNCSGRWIGQNTCTHTKRERGPWWYVDLGSRHAISSVVVKNRADCCGERLQGAEIRVGNFVSNHGKNNPLCGRITDTRLGSISTISCNGRVGRYVTVTVPSRTVSLALCEVEVYGTRVLSPENCEPGQGQG
ncbi:fucolectin-like isoform X2 [Crotalus tigris]|nr:fucolectin-like isoform X2 [Crotalus tigris]XP_039177325.1 fucolectin-like isoform X2 [Crotalus tigris]XP_039177326.1 fucolectin-like isoform X2 [Crotalus tigris]